MTKITIGIATMFLGLMTACAVDSGRPPPSEPPASAETVVPDTSETSSDLLQPGPVTPHFCINFYQGPGNYYQCASTEQWFHNGGQCAANCPEGACGLDLICGNTSCSCVPN